ncbi:hypothetical protein ACSS6W_004685 [Trichoderma asperelloides]
MRYPISEALLRSYHLYSLFSKKQISPILYMRLLKRILQIIIISSSSLWDVVPLANKRFPMLHYFLYAYSFFTLFFYYYY